MFKNFNFTKDPTSTIMGILSSALAVVVLLGYLSGAESIELQEYVGGILAGVIGIYNMFFSNDQKRIEK